MHASVMLCHKGKVLQLGYILQDDVDIVIEAEKGPAELWGMSESIDQRSIWDKVDIPLSPFIITHILDPTHLSTSSVGPSQLESFVVAGSWGYHPEVGLEMPYLLCVLVRSNKKDRGG